VQAHRQGRCSAAILGPVIRRLLASEFVLASRLAKSLRAVLRIEPALAGEVFDLLAETISANPAAPPKDTAKLLELLQETMLTSGRSLPATAHSDLAAMQIGGQGLRIRKALLGSGRI
jgi:hypothetical protein